MQAQQPEALIRMMTQPSHPLKIIVSVINILIIGLTVGLVIWLFNQPNEHQPCLPRQEFVPTITYDDKKLDRLTQMIGSLLTQNTPPPPPEDHSDDILKINKRLAKLEKWIMTSDH
jgi:hypothetical protein